MVPVQASYYWGNLFLLRLIISLMYLPSAFSISDRSAGKWGDALPVGRSYGSGIRKDWTLNNLIWERSLWLRPA